jgi:hypothetical protein
MTSNKVIRRSAFETNSSSTHSLTINFGKLEAEGLYKGKTLEIETGEFGWEEEDYTDWQSKASYALTAANGSYGDNKQSKKMDMLEKVIQEHTGAASVVFLDLKYGYIDHQSYKVADEIFESEDTLKNFIFNENSVLHTDNDNH